MNLATIGWPSGADTGWPSEPRNMLPGRVEGFPAGVQASANTAERLLTQAVAYWDASQYRDGDRFLRNRGVAGDLLDLRLGSSVVANSNDPLFLAPEDTGYAYLPGVTGNYLSVPDEAALDITGDIDIRVRVALDDWTPSAHSTLARKWASGQDSWHFYVSSTTGRLVFVHTSNGSAVKSRESTVATGVTDGTLKWVRVTLDVDNGAAGHDVKFWLSDDGSVWQQLGSTVTTAGTSSVFAGTAVVGVGSTLGSVTVAAGKFYRAIVKDGIDGATVLDIDCSQITSGSNTSFTALTGQTVTINRSTSGRKSVAVPSRANRGGALFLFGTDDYMEVVDNWQHSLLNFGQGDSFTVVAVVRSWGTINAGTGVNKRNAASLSNPGWSVTNVIELADTAGIVARGFVGIVSGGTSVNTAVITRPIQSARAFVNAVGGTVLSISAIDSMVNTQPVRIGHYPAVGYGNFEFRSAAVWRRALTETEIAALNTYFQNRSI